MIITQNTALNRETHNGWFQQIAAPRIFNVSFGIDIHLAAVVIDFYNVPGKKTVSDDSVDTVPIDTA